MFKLIVLSVLIACALAAVVPKAPSSDIKNQKNESPAVKMAPVRLESQKPSDAKHSVKHTESANQQGKSAKKDEQQRGGLKTSKQQQGQQKQSASHVHSAKEKPQHQAAHLEKGKQSEQKGKITETKKQ